MHSCNILLQTILECTHPQICLIPTTWVQADVQASSGTHLYVHTCAQALTHAHFHPYVYTGMHIGTADVLTQLEARHSISGMCSGRKNDRNSPSSINPDPSVSTILTMETRSSSEIADGLMFARRTARRNSENDKDPLPFVSDNLKSPFQSSSSSNFVACVGEATDERRRQSALTLCATREAASTRTQTHARTSENVFMRVLAVLRTLRHPSSPSNSPYRVQRPL